MPQSHKLPTQKSCFLAGKQYYLPGFGCDAVGLKIGNLCSIKLNLLVASCTDHPREPTSTATTLKSVTNRDLSASDQLASRRVKWGKSTLSIAGKKQKNKIATRMKIDGYSHP